MTKISKKYKKLRWLITALPVLVIVGCTVGPDYKAPQVTVAQTYRDQPAQPDASSLADAPWWTVFDDKALQSLVDEALANNLDIQVAIARVDQARALVGVVHSEALPQIGYQAFAGGERSAAPGTPGGALTYATYGGLINAAWELDVWGKIRRATESARANLMAQEDIRRGVMLTLVSDLAADYFVLLQLDRELAIALQSVEDYKTNVRLFTLRYEAGRDSRLAVDRAEADYQSSQENVAELKRQIGQQENVISVLVGAYPRGIERGRPLVDQSMPPTPLGQTTDLLKRRPDILEAEQRMIQANADVGVAQADFYPTIGLSALVGGQGLNLDNAKFAGFGIWNAAGQVAGPIFTGGRLTETLRQRRAYWDETVAQYKNTILTAFRETSDALIAQRSLVDRRAALQGQVEALRHAVQLSLLRFDNGRASYFEVLEAEQQLYPAEYTLAQTQGDQLVAVVNLYKALGGGWKLSDAQWVKPQ
jgi:multidrug efflux system outer membrane protein